MRPYKDILNDEISIAGGKISSVIEQYAKNNHRYQNRTHNLTDSTTMNTEIVNNTLTSLELETIYYGVYVNKGHGTWLADPWLQSAIEANVSVIDRELSLASDRAWHLFTTQGG